MKENKTKPKGFEKLLLPEEGSLLWDEYKYRHDLIWKHLIRSTIAVIALVIVPYSEKLDTGKTLVLGASVLAIGYIIFTIRVIYREIKCFNQINRKHRKRQSIILGLRIENADEDDATHFKSGFGLLVLFYLWALFVFIVLASALNIYQIFDSSSR